MTKQYVIVDVGCIECGETTAVLSVHRSLVKAQEALMSARTSFIADSAGNYFAGGQHCISMYEVTKDLPGRAEP